MRYVFTLDVIRNQFGEPVRHGTELMSFLPGTTVLIADDEAQAVNRFLKVHNIHPDVVISDEDTEELDWALDRQLHLGNIDTFFTCDPTLAAESVSRGVTTCLVIHPKISVAAIQPGSVRWDDLVQEIDRQAGITIDLDSVIVEDE